MRSPKGSFCAKDGAIFARFGFAFFVALVQWIMRRFRPLTTACMNSQPPFPGAPHSGPLPGVLFWFKAYCALMCLMYLAVAVGSLFFFLVPPEKLEMGQTEASIIGGIFLAMGLPLFGLFLVPFFTPFRPWAWGYAMAMICIGMLSACFWPICIPLMIFWLKPEVKAIYGVRG